MSTCDTGKNAQETAGYLLATDAGPDTENPTDNEDRCRLRCRSKTVVSSDCFQPLATARWTLTFFSASNLLRQVVLNGLIAVTISTLEKRFELRSTESGLIASMADFSLGICLVLMMFVPSNVDKPQIMGWGLVLSGVAIVMFAVPHFTAPEYVPNLGDVSNYCGNVTESDCNQSTLRNYLYWFVVCFCIVGAGVCPFVVYSVTYLDENVNKNVSTLYNAIYMSLGGLGPAIGFVLGGMSLEFYTYISMNPHDLTINNSSYSWVGAWWIGYVLFGIFLIASAVPILLLPNYLPGTEKHRQNRDVETQKGHLKSTAANDQTNSISGTLSEIFYLVQNKPYILMTFGLTMNCALVFGFNTFGSKYLESVFGLKPFYAALSFGITSIFACFGAQITGGLVVKKFKLQVPGILKFMIVVAVLSAVCSIGFVVHCEDISFAGASVPYENSSESLSVYSSCNSHCGCSTDRYEPVCADGVMFYSPCFAGCGVKLNDTSYGNCSCVGSEIIASSETCDWKSCSLIIPFMLIIFICFFSSILTMPAAIQVIMRCVPFNKRDMAMSLQFAIRHIIGIVPGRLLVGYVLDQACVAWSTECGQQGSCKIYNRWDIAKYNMTLLIAQTVICCVTYILVLVTYKPVGEIAKSAAVSVQVELQTLPRTTDDRKQSTDI